MSGRRSISRFVICTGLFLFQATFSAQNQPFDNFRSLRCTGPVPEYFKQPLAEQESSFDRFLDPGKDKKAQEKVLGMLRYSNYHVREKFSSGFVLFGEELSNYVQGVTAHILKHNPRLPSDMKVYVVRAPDVNAATYASGVILINVGMLAHVNNEAELASVICHEMAHFTQKHSVLDVYENYEESRKKRRLMWVDDYMEYQQSKVDKHYSRNRQQEFEADSLGLLWFKNTGYDAQALSSLFHVLHNADNSYGTIPVDMSFFKLGNVVLPASFYLDNIKASAPFEEHSDRYYTHPNAGVRLKAVERLSRKEGIKTGGSSFITVTEQQFLKLRDQARFEQLRLMLSYGQFGDVIYNSYVLLQKYPGNKYLETCIAKAFYGLARYKNADDYNLVARSYTQVEGEGQRVHYLLKQFNRKQLNAYALKMLVNTSKKYPEESFLDSLESDMVRDMVVMNELKAEDFEAGKMKDELVLALMKDEVKDPIIRKKFALYYPHLEKKKEDDQKSYKDREKEKLALEKDKKKNGPGIKASKVVLAPSVAHLDKEGQVQPQESETLRQGMMAALTEISKKTNLGCAQICANEKDKVADDYNRLALMNQCVLEFNLHRNYRLRPLNADHVWGLADEYQTPLVLFTSCNYSEKTKNFKYIASLYNMRSCKVVHYSSHTGKGAPSQKELQAFLEEDFETVKR